MPLSRPDLQRDILVLERRITRGPGTVPAEQRRAVADGEPGGGALGAYLDRVRDEAIEVSDAETGSG